MAEQIDFDPSGAQPVGGGERVDFDTEGVAPAKEVGGFESAARHFGLQAGRFGKFALQTAGALVGAAEKAKNAITGGEDTPLAQGFIEMGERIDQANQKEYGLKPNEVLTTAGKVGAFVGGVAPHLMTLGAATPGIEAQERYQELEKRGATAEEALTGAATTGAVNVASNLIPMGVGKYIGGKVGLGKVGQTVAGAAGGAATNVPVETLGAVAQNVSLPKGEQYESLKHEIAPTAEGTAMGALFGALHAPGAARSTGKKGEAAKPFEKVAEEHGFKPNGEGEYTTPSGDTITPEDWDNSSARVRQGWLKKAPEEKTSEQPTTPEAPEKKPEFSARAVELARLREKATHPEVLEHIDKEIEAEHKKQADLKKGEEFANLAKETDDPTLREELSKKAEKLGYEEPAPKGHEELYKAAKETEVTTAGKDAETIATEVDAAQHADWQKRHDLDDQEAAQAERIHEAMQIDKPAVDEAAKAHAEDEPAFHKEIERIISERPNQEAAPSGKGETEPVREEPGPNAVPGPEGENGGPNALRNEQGGEPAGPGPGAESAPGGHERRAERAGVSGAVRRPFRNVEESHRRTIMARAKEVGAKLTEEQARHIAPITRDVVTGFHTANQRIPTLERARVHAEKTGESAHYVEADISNLGGLNKEFGHSGADEHFRAMTDIFAEEMRKTGGDVELVRHGGDEISAIVVNADRATVERAAAKAKARTLEYAKEKGLSELEHPKHVGDKSKQGTGINYGVSEINERPTKEILSEADKRVELEKLKGKENVHGATTKETRIGAPEKQATGTSESAKRKPTAGRTEVPFEKKPEKATAAQGQETVAKIATAETKLKLEDDQQAAEKLSKSIGRDIQMEVKDPSEVERGPRGYEFRAARRLAERFGKDVIYVKQSEQIFAGAHQGGKIFLSVDTKHPVRQIFGHELLHAMRHDSPKSYDELRELLRPLLAGKQKYFDNLNQRRADKGLEPLHTDALEEEMIADTVGDRFQETEFYRELAKQDLPAFQRVIAKIKDWITDTINKLRGQSNNARYVNDLRKAQKVIGEVMAKYGRVERVARAAVEPRKPEVKQEALPLRRGIELTIAKAQPAERWVESINKMRGVDKAEVESSGVIDWLKQQDGRVDKEAVLDYLDKHKEEAKPQLSLEQKEPETKGIGVGGISTKARNILSAAKDYINRGFYDNLSELHAAQKELGKPLSDAANAYDVEIASHGRKKVRLEDIIKGVMEPIHEIAAKEKLTQQDISDYLYAKHAPEANKYIESIRQGFKNGSGMSDAHAKEVIDSYTPEQRTALEEISGIVKKMNDEKLDRMVDEGLISADTRKDLKERFKNWVSLKNFDDESILGGGSKVGGKGPGYEVKGKEFKARSGRVSKAEDPLSMTINDAMMAVVRAEGNRVAQAVHQLVKENPNPEIWEKVTEANYPTRKDRNAAGEVVTVKDPTALMHDPHYFGAKFNGEQQWVRIKSDKLARQLAKMGQSGFPDNAVGDVLRAVNSFTRVFSMLHTQVSLDFPLMNAIRDVQEAGMNVSGFDKEKGAKLAMDAIKKIPASLKTSAKVNIGELFGKEFSDADAKLFKQAGYDGAFTGGYGMMDAEAVQNMLRQMIEAASGNPKAKAIVMAKNAFEPIMRINDSLENMTRFAVYKAALEAGFSRQQAAVMSKKSTLNFDKRGEASPYANAIWAFFNAGCQGTKAFFVAARDSNIVRGAIAAVFAAGLAEPWTGEEDETGTNKKDIASEFKRDKNLTYLLGDHVLTLPLGQGLTIPYMTGRHVSRVLQGRQSVADAIGDVLSGMWNIYFPVNTLAPTAIAPLVEAQQNKDFAGRKIAKENPFDKITPVSSQYREDANESFVAFAKALNQLGGGTETKKAGVGFMDISPEKMQYVFKQYMGGVSLPFELGSAAVSEKPMKIEEYPVARRFVVGQKEDFYRNQSAKVTQAADNRHKEIASGEEVPGDEIGHVDTIRGMESDIRMLTKNRNLAKKAGNDTGVFDEQLNELYKRVVTLDNEFKKEHR